MQHDPVMLREILEILPLRPGAVVVDGTLGLGGHSSEFVKAIAPSGILYGFDWDDTMLRQAEATIEAQASVLHLPKESLRFVHDDFRTIAEHVERKANAI